MAITISADLKRAVIINEAMKAFKKRLLPLGLFSTAFNSVPLEGTNEVVVPYFPLESSASKNFNGTYEFGDGNIGSKKITINKRKYQSLKFTSEELARQPYFDLVAIGQAKGAKLAEDVLIDILSVITAANFGDAVATSTAANFDVDDVIDIRTACAQANWPEMNRGMILDSSYIGNLQKSIVSQGGAATFGFTPLGELPTLQGFRLAEFNLTPNNSENLVGFVVNPSAILVGFSPIAPAPSVMKTLSEYSYISDPDTGLTLEYRAWGDPDSDTSKEVIECNYGFAVGETAALKRIISAPVSEE